MYQFYVSVSLIPVFLRHTQFVFKDTMAVQSGKRLTDSKLRNIAPNSNQLTSSSVAGLVFKPSSCTKGTGTWILRYYDKVSKKRIKITLGHYPKMGIASAEKEAKF